MKATKTYTLLALLMMAGGVMAQNTCWDGTVAEAYAGGDGTPENPYQIATAEQLALLAQQTNDGIGGNAYYMLTDNICLNENTPMSIPCFGHPSGMSSGTSHPISRVISTATK